MRIARRHGQIDVRLARLAELDTVDATVAAFLAAAVRSPCNIIVTGGVAAGKPTIRLGQP
jgi:Flp pilus assembly CpaF family ATPase